MDSHKRNVFYTRSSSAASICPNWMQFPLCLPSSRCSPGIATAALFLLLVLPSPFPPHLLCEGALSVSLACVYGPLAHEMHRGTEVTIMKKRRHIVPQ